MAKRDCFVTDLDEFVFVAAAHSVKSPNVLPQAGVPVSTPLSLGGRVATW